MNKTIEDIIKWLEIYEKEGGIPLEMTAHRFRVEVQHSALLKRIMEGKEIFDEPPPISFGYPWYKLMEDGVAYPFEVSHMPDKTTCNGVTKGIYINQWPWHILKRDGDDYIVSPAQNAFRKKKYKGRWRLSKTDKWVLTAETK